MVKTLKDLDIKNKRVIIRCDFNVPYKNGKIIDDTRIIESIDTIKYCIDNNCKIILLSHKGRIKEEKDLKENTLKPVAKRLTKLLHRTVRFSHVTRGEELENMVSKLKNKQVLLIENTRYEDLNGKKESSNDKKLAKYWSKFGDVFINDAFGTMHRSHASNVGIANNLPSCVGLLVEKELNKLEELKNPERPFVLILGGKKVSDKIPMIENLIDKVDYILLGGGMANTFLSAESFNLGKSLIDEESIDFCKKMLKKYADKIVLPVDLKVNNKIDNNGKIEIKDITDFDEDDIALDIGSKTVKIYEDILKTSKIVFWNGPLGIYEYSNFIQGTKEILNYLVDNDIKTILGGGDVVAAASILKLKDKVYHASTGGGATLEFLEGKTLEGLKAIK